MCQVRFSQSIPRKSENTTFGMKKKEMRVKCKNDGEGEDNERKSSAGVAILMDTKELTVFPKAKCLCLRGTENTSCPTCKQTYLEIQISWEI